MARTWKRYRPPSVTVDESGSRSETTGTGTGGSRKPSRSADSKTVASAKPGRLSKRTAWIVGIVLAVVAGGVVWAIAAKDDDGVDEVSTETLSADFIEAGMEVAGQRESDDPFRLRLSSYDLSIEYFDAQRQELRTYSFSGYGDGYEIRVRPNEYDDYRPRQIPLEDIDPEVLVEVGNLALDEVDDAEGYDVVVEQASSSRAPQIVATARPDDYEDQVEITTDLDGGLVG